MTTEMAKVSLTELVRSITLELGRTKKFFYMSDVYDQIQGRSNECSEPIFDARADYSRSVEGAMATLLNSREVLFDPFDLRRFVTQDSLTEILREKRKR